MLLGEQKPPVPRFCPRRSPWGESMCPCAFRCRAAWFPVGQGRLRAAYNMHPAKNGEGKRNTKETLDVQVRQEFPPHS